MKRFPTSYRFPGNTRVHVRIMTDKWFDEQGYDPSVLAFWDGDKQLVRLRRSRSQMDMIDDLLHELDHAWVDAREWLKEELVKAGQIPAEDPPADNNTRGCK